MKIIDTLWLKNSCLCIVVAFQGGVRDMVLRGTHTFPHHLQAMRREVTIETDTPSLGRGVHMGDQIDQTEIPWNVEIPGKDMTGKDSMGIQEGEENPDLKVGALYLGSG